MPLIISPRQLNQRAQFYQQFGQLLGAGVSVLQALELIGRNPPSRAFRAPIQGLIARITQGDSIVGSIRAIGGWLPDFDIALLEAGEHSGRLDAVARMLAGYYEDRARMLRQMLADMAYPVFVLHFAVLIFPMISVFNGGTLAQYLFKTLGVLIPAYLCVFLLVYAAQGKHGLKWRAWLERILRNVPVLGKARHALALARLAAALEVLLSAGVTIIEAWEMAASASGSPAIERTVRAWKPRLQSGETPSEAVRACPLFPEMFASFYHSGEMSGQLDDSLRQLYRFYQEEGSRKMHFLAQWVPRCIYLCVAGYVAFRVISFYTDYFNQLKQIF